MPDLKAPTAADHPWLDGRFEAVATLTPELRVWTFLAGNTATGNLERVARDWSFVGPGAQQGGLEAILQTHLFAGYPRVINALAAVREIGVVAGGTPTEADHAGDWPRDGEALCRRIYGAGYDGLRRRMHTLHPDLDRWMVEIGYGRVLSRPGLTARERELCALAVLAGQDVKPQLSSHLRGAIRVDATPSECRAILDQTGVVWCARAQKQTDRVWQELEEQLRMVVTGPT